MVAAAGTSLAMQIGSSFAKDDTTKSALSLGGKGIGLLGGGLSSMGGAGASAGMEGAAAGGAGGMSSMLPGMGAGGMSSMIPGLGSKGGDASSAGGAMMPPGMGAAPSPPASSAINVGGPAIERAMNLGPQGPLMANGQFYSGGMTAPGPVPQVQQPSPLASAAGASVDVLKSLMARQPPKVEIGSGNAGRGVVGHVPSPNLVEQLPRGSGPMQRYLALLRRG